MGIDSIWSENLTKSTTDYVNEFLETCAKEKTRRTYRAGIAQILKSVPLDKIYSSSANELEKFMKEYVKECINKKQSFATIRNRLGIFKIFTEWSEIRGYSKAKFYGLPYRSIPKGVVYTRKERFSLEEFASLLETAKNQKNKAKAARDYALLRLHFDLTLRSEEALDIIVPDMNIGHDQRWVSVIQKRYLHTNTKHIPEKTSEALQDWLEARNRHIRFRYADRKGLFAGPLFISLERKNKEGIRKLDPGSWVHNIADLCKKAGIRPMDTQDIRSLSITHAIALASQEGLMRSMVTAQTGHRSSASLDSYEGFPSKLQAIFSSELSRLV